MRGQPGPQYTTARPIATQFPGSGCIDDLTTVRSFDLQATWVIGVFILCFAMLYMGVFKQPGTGRHLVVLSRNVMSVL